MTATSPFSGDPERDRRNLAILMEGIADLFGPRGLDELMRNAVDRAILVTQAERGILLLEDGEEPRPQVARGREGGDMPLTQRFSQTVVRKVWTTGEAYKTVDAADPTAASLGASVLELKLLSIMATPLVVKGERLGVLYVDSTVHTKEFTNADFDVFKTLGEMIAMAVLIARLNAEALEKERIEQQIALAGAVQSRLLPAHPTPPPGYDLAGQGRPCEEMSGDYYDVIPLANGHVALVVGDVSGHGIGPALYMSSTRALIRGLMGEGSDALKVVGTLNRFLARDMEEHSFMSLFLGVLDPDGRLIRYTSAGHNPPLLVRAAGGVEELGCTGPVLAVFEEARYRESEAIRLHSGDALALYTDGIYEAHARDGSMYGEERFRDSLERHVRDARGAQAIVDGVLADLDTYCVGRALDDDITLLVLRVA